MDNNKNSFTSMNDAQPVLELKTMARGQPPAADEYVLVTAPSNLPAEYELTVEVMDGSFWTIQVVRTAIDGWMDGTPSRSDGLHRPRSCPLTAHPSLSCCDDNFSQPDGGVTMNESFRAKVLHKTGMARPELVYTPSFVSKSDPFISNQSNRVKFHIPTGRWRDGIFDFCILPLHPVVFVTYLWPLITLGQVMTRIQFKICGDSDNRSQFCPPAFDVMLAITIISLVFQLMFGGIVNMLLLVFRMDIPSETSYDGGDEMVEGLHFMVKLGLLIFITVVHTKTRNQMRRAYSIGSDRSCVGDCCCAFWCGFCSISQMARHTANYHNTHRARCCTPNGLDEEWEDYDFLTVDPNVHPQRFTGAMMV